VSTTALPRLAVVIFRLTLEIRAIMGSFVGCSKDVPPTLIARADRVIE
jgi:hypothetical protein